jgi:hypothetical protein
MRLIKISSPQGKGPAVAETAFSVGIKNASLHQVEQLQPPGQNEWKDVVELQTSTPKAKQFVDEILKSSYYNAKDYSFSVRSPRSIVARENMPEVTKPLPETAVDILQELYQFSYITYSFVGRVLIAGCLLTYGMIQQQLLVMIAGLLFLPLLPLLQAVGFGLWTGQTKLALQGAIAFLLAVLLLVLGGIVVAAMTDPPLRYNEFNSLLSSFLISLIVGAAAGLAIIDDVGKREMIGLAASSQIAIIPVWLGICIVFGLPATVSSDQVLTRITSFAINVVTITVAAAAVHILTGAASSSLNHLENK